MGLDHGRGAKRLNTFHNWPTHPMRLTSIQSVMPHLSLSIRSWHILRSSIQGRKFVSGCDRQSAGCSRRSPADCILPTFKTSQAIPPSCTSYTQPEANIDVVWLLHTQCVACYASALA